MHLSHILLFGLVLIVIFVFRKFILPQRQNRTVQILILLVLVISTILTMGSALSKSRHVFFMGAMVEHGITKKYLDDYCKTKQFKLCAYKDSLPDKAYKFVWDEKSPLYKIGGWKKSKDEFNEIIKETLVTPKYFRMHIQESIKATMQQLTHFGIGDGNGHFLEGTLLYERVAKYFPDDLAHYSGSKQNQSRLNFLEFLNSLFSFVMVLSLLLLIFLLSKFWGSLNRLFKTITILIFTGVIINAWDCGTFANAIDRLGCKMAWLIIFLVIILLRKVSLDRMKIQAI
jgi:hypothetical protein